MDTIESLSTKIRDYFFQHKVTEVKTPCLIPFPTTEPNIKSFSVSQISDTPYLRTSPESALKQIVCKEEIDVFELGPVFRDEESSENHLTEFTMVEWYRVTMSYKELMDDVVGLLEHIGLSRKFVKVRYDELFEEAFGFTPAGCSISELKSCALQCGLIASEDDLTDRNFLIEFLTSHLNNTHLRDRGLVFVYDYPVELRCYSELTLNHLKAAKRFELFWDGLEIANGYQEILSEDEQLDCFNSENKRRVQKGLSKLPIDVDWLDSLRYSALRSLAGVALGLERVLMKINGIEDIRLL